MSFIKSMSILGPHTVLPTILSEINFESDLAVEKV